MTKNPTRHEILSIRQVQAKTVDKGLMNLMQLKAIFIGQWLFNSKGWPVVFFLNNINCFPMYSKPQIRILAISGSKYI